MKNRTRTEYQPFIFIKMGEKNVLGDCFGQTRHRFVVFRDNLEILNQINQKYIYKTENIK